MVYRATPIKPVSGGFGEYERSPESLDELFGDEYDAEEALREGATDTEMCEVYEVGRDELSDGVEDIRGLVHGGDPLRLYAVSEPDGTISYFAVDRA